MECTSNPFRISMKTRMRSIRAVDIAATCSFLLQRVLISHYRTSSALPVLFRGIVRGFLAIFALIGSLFWDVRVYAFPNTGYWYVCGFLSGLSTSLLVAGLSVMGRVGGWIA